MPPLERLAVAAEHDHDLGVDGALVVGKPTTTSLSPNRCCS